MDPETLPRRRWLATSTAAMGLGALRPGAAEAQAPAPANAAKEVNVRDLGAVGDGRVENAERDTQAFLLATLGAKVAGAVIRVPMGTYVLNKPIRLDGQHLLGHVAGGWNPDPLVLPTLSVMHAAGPAITLGAGSSLHGLAILDSLVPDGGGGLRQDPARRFVPRPPTVRIEGTTSISNLKISMPFDGISSSERSENGRMNIENVFIIAPGRDGVYASGSSDIPTLRNVEVWCSVGPSKGVGFRFGQNDEIHGSRLFAFNCEVGFGFQDPPTRGRGTYGTFVDCATDACVRGWIVTGGARLNLLGGNFLNHFEGILLRGPTASLRLTGAWLKSNGAPAVACDEADDLIVTGCEINGDGNNPVPYIRIGTERAHVERASVSGCHFNLARAPHYRPGIAVGPGVHQCLIQGNIFTSGPEAKVIVQNGPGSDVVIGSNAGEPVVGR